MRRCVALLAVGLMTLAQSAQGGMESYALQCAQTAMGATCFKGKAQPVWDASDWAGSSADDAGLFVASTAPDDASVSFTHLASTDLSLRYGALPFSAGLLARASAIEEVAAADPEAQVSAVPLPGAAGLLLFGLFAMRPRRIATHLRTRFPGGAMPAGPSLFGPDGHFDAAAEATLAARSTKVLLVSLNFSPELTGIGKYSGEMVDGWIARGHEVTVVCAPPYYPAWQVQDGHSARGYRTERPVPGLTIHRCPLWVPARPGGAARLLHLASFALSSLPVLVWLVLWRPKTVFVVVPALFCAPGAWLVARLAGAKAWLHVQDLEIDAAFELGLLKQPQLRRLAIVGERFLLRRFDVVSTISRRMLRKLADKGVAAEKLEMLPNWVDLSTVRPGPRSDALRSSLGITSAQTVCLYSGTLNRKQGLSVLIQAARRMQQDLRVVFVICGNGEMRAELEASAGGLANLRFMDLQPALHLNQLLNMADIHLLPQLRGAADLVMPSKLVGMLASGRPVIAAASAGSEIADTVIGCGIIVEPECADGFVQAIASLTDDAERRNRLGAAGRSHAEHMLDARNIFERLHLRLLSLDHQPSIAPVARGSAANRIGAEQSVS